MCSHCYVAKYVLPCNMTHQLFVLMNVEDCIFFQVSDSFQSERSKIFHQPKGSILCPTRVCFCHFYLQLSNVLKYEISIYCVQRTSITTTSHNYIPDFSKFISKIKLLSLQFHLDILFKESLIDVL